MAAFNTLTPEEQKQVLDFVTTFRGYVSEMAKTLNRLAAENDDYLGVIGPILNGVDAGVPLPLDSSGLAGIAPLTPFQIGTMMNHMQALLTTNTDGNRQIWAGACGPTNLT